MILVTEMVGDIRSLMPLGHGDLAGLYDHGSLHGAPVYEAMLGNCCRIRRKKKES